MQPESHGTDERLETAAPKKRDMDARFLAGCITIAVLSIGFYALAAWPFFAFPAHMRSGLVSIALYGALPSLVLGVLVVRRIGLEGATAFIGGSLASGVFAYLRLDSLMLGKIERVRDLPAPDYPEAWAWIAPLGWCLLVVAAALLALPKSEMRDEGSADADR